MATYEPCKCPNQQNRVYAAMWTNAGIAAHVHTNGVTGAGGSEGVCGPTAYAAVEALKETARTLLDRGWLPRGW